MYEYTVLYETAPIHANTRTVKTKVTIKYMYQRNSYRLSKNTFDTYLLR